MFGRDAGVAEAWLCSQEPLVRSAELGCTVDEVESLIKRHEAFQKSAVAWEERFSALEKLTAVRATGPQEHRPPLSQAPHILLLEEDISLLPIAPDSPRCEPKVPCGHLTSGSHGFPCVALRDSIFPMAPHPHLFLEFSSPSFLFCQTRAETLQFSPMPRIFYALTSEFLGSWRNRRRSGKERGRKRNGESCPLLQNPQPVCLKGTWWTATRPLPLPGTGESWDTWGRKRRLSQSNPTT